MSTPTEDCLDTILLQQSIDGVNKNVSDSARNVIREVSTDTQFLNAGQREIIQDVHGVALGLTNGQASTDRNVDQGVLGLERGLAAADRNVDSAARHLSSGQRLTDQEIARGFLGVNQGLASVDRNADAGFRHLDKEIDDVDRDVLHSSAKVEHGQRETDRNVDQGFRWQDREIHDFERGTDQNFRSVERGQRISDDRNSDGFYRTARDIDTARLETSRGFAHTNEEMSEAFCDTNEKIGAGFAHTNEEMAEAFGDVTKELYGTERRLDNTVRNGSDAAQARMADAENRLTRGGYESEQRLTRDVTAAERRLGHQIDKDVTHNLEEVSEALSDHDRRTSIMLEKLHGDIRLEAERTRDSVVRTDLESRLYFRDREDRTHDLVRSLSDRNLDEMRGFERRSRDDEGKTRDLIRHVDAERAERDYIALVSERNELKTRLALLESRGGERREHGRSCGCGHCGYYPETFRFDPRINITLDDNVYDENDNDNRATARSRSKSSLA